MKSCRRFRILPVVLLLAAPALAQTDLNWAELTGTCGIFSVQLAAELDIVTALPAHWTGWVVDRTTIGECEPVVPVYGPVAFPAGARTYDFVDPGAAPGQAYGYRIRAVDAAGNRYYLSAGGEFPPAYYQTAYTTCEGAIAARGRLTGTAPMPTFEECPDQCWLPISFVSELPAQLESLVGTTAVVELRGTLADEFEGPYVTGVTGWTVLGGCGSVPDVPDTWSGLKADYR